MKKRNEDSIGFHIYNSLTEKQIISLLDEIFSQMNEKMRKKILKKLDDDIFVTLKSIFSLKGSPEEGNVISIASDKKYIEDWKNLWKEWDKIVSQVGDEEGNYVDPGDEWEDPYFKGQDLINDLEEIGEKILPLVNKIYLLNVSKDNIFHLKLEELDKRIGEYPEYIITEDDFSLMMLDHSMTSAFLEWEWCIVKSKNLPVGEYLIHFVELEDTFDKFLIDFGAYTEFFLNLPEEYGREICEHINQNKDKDPWIEKLEVVTFIWNDIYFALANRFNPEHYLEMCDERFSEDWELGLPLFENYMREEKYIEAEKTLEKLFEILIGERSKTGWRPEKSLLAEYLSSKFGIYNRKIVEPLIKWISLCENLKMEQRKKALEIQLGVFQKPDEWDTILKLFEDLNSSSFNEMASEIFNSWQNFIFYETVSSIYIPEKEKKETWIQWLLSASFCEDKEWFSEKVLSWINSLPEFYEDFDIQQELFYMFTADVFDQTGSKKEYPRLFKFIIKEYYEKLRFTSNRRDFLSKMEPEQFIKPVLDYWRKYITKMVPDPSRASGSKYFKHASMLSVVRELSNVAYLNILRDWKFRHKRKRSLWREIGMLGLPVEGKW